MPKSTITVCTYDKEQRRGLPKTTRTLREALETDVAAVLPQVAHSDYYNVAVKRQGVNHYDTLFTVTYTRQRYHDCYRVIRSLFCSTPSGIIRKRVTTKLDCPKYSIALEKEQEEYFWYCVLRFMVDGFLP